MLPAEGEKVGLGLVGIGNDVATTGDALDEVDTDGTADRDDLDAAMEDLDIFQASITCEREHCNFLEDLVSLHVQYFIVVVCN